MALNCSRVAEPVHAFGLALDLLFTRTPFRDHAFGPFAASVKGQILRGHYVFTFRDGVPAGYAGWGLCDAAVARAWIERRRMPRHDECLAGGTFVGFVFSANGRDVAIRQARYCRETYPQHEFAYLREYGARRRMFDSATLAWRHRRDPV